MISVFVRCARSLYTRDGLADQVAVLARIPFTKDFRVRKMESEDWTSSILSGLLVEDGSTVYMGLKHGWTPEDRMETLDPFGKLLLAACPGAVDPRLLGWQFASHHLEGNEMLTPVSITGIDSMIWSGR